MSCLQLNNTLNLDAERLDTAGPAVQLSRAQGPAQVRAALCLCRHPHGGHPASPSQLPGQLGRAGADGAPPQQLPDPSPAHQEQLACQDGGQAAAAAGRGRPRPACPLLRRRRAQDHGRRLHQARGRGHRAAPCAAARRVQGAGRRRGSGCEATLGRPDLLPQRRQGGPEADTEAAQGGCQVGGGARQATPGHPQELQGQADGERGQDHDRSGPNHGVLL